jgi:hypothetical protein
MTYAKNLKCRWCAAEGCYYLQKTEWANECLGATHSIGPICPDHFEYLTKVALKKERIQDLVGSQSYPTRRCEHAEGQCPYRGSLFHPIHI